MNVVAARNISFVAATPERVPYSVFQTGLLPVIAAKNDLASRELMIEG
jgi:hypothetical protein